MFKKIARGAGHAIKPFVNVPKWLAWGDIKRNNKVLKDLSVGIFTSPSESPVEKETFEEALKRLNLTEAKLNSRKQALLFMTSFYIVIGTGLFCYAIFLLFVQGFVMATLISLTLVWVALALAFKEHFWYTQITYRHLGMSFRDWASHTFKLKRGKSHEA